MNYHMFGYENMNCWLLLSWDWNFKHPALDVLFRASQFLQNVSLWGLFRITVSKQQVFFKNILQLHLWNTNHTSTFLPHHSKRISLVYKRRYATGQVEKEMDDLDLSRGVSSDAWRCAPHVWCLIGAQPEESGRERAVPLRCQKPPAFLTRQGLAAGGCVRLAFVNRLDMDTLSPLGLGRCFAMLVYFETVLWVC